MSIVYFRSPVRGKEGYRVSVSYSVGGKMYRKTCTCLGTAIEAQAMEQRLREAAERIRLSQNEKELYELAHSKVVNAKPIKMVDAYDVAMSKPQNHDVSDNKKSRRQGQWMDFVGWMKVKYPLFNYMHDVKKEHAEEYVSFIRKYGSFVLYQQEKKKNILSADTLNMYQLTCKSVFELLLDDIGLHENPFAKIPLLRANHAEREAYTEEQLKIIFANADEYVYPMFFIGFFTGLSEGDICTLKKKEINFEHHHIYRKRNKTLASTGKISAIPMLPALEGYLRGLVDNPGNLSEYILPLQAEEYLHNRSIVSHKVKNFLKNTCNFDTCRQVGKQQKMQSVLDFHSLRHTFCSMAGIAGIPLNVVQSIVGHMSPKMTELYSRHVDEQERLRCIQLFGEKVKEIPNIPVMIEEHPDDGIPQEKERIELIELIKTMGIDSVKDLLSIAKEFLNPTAEM